MLSACGLRSLDMRQLAILSDAKSCVWCVLFKLMLESTPDSNIELESGESSNMISLQTDFDPHFDWFDMELSSDKTCLQRSIWNVDKVTNYTIIMFLHPSKRAMSASVSWCFYFEELWLRWCICPCGPPVMPWLLMQSFATLRSGAHGGPVGLGRLERWQGVELGINPLLCKGEFRVELGLL